MATESVSIDGSDYEAKLRNLWPQVGLLIITFGIYGIYWYYKVNQEMAHLGRVRSEPRLGDSPGMSLLAVTLGALVIVPAILSMWNTGKRIALTQEMLDREESNVNVIFFLLAFFTGIGGVLYGQHVLNQAWVAQGASAPASTSTTDADGPEPAFP